MSHHAPLRIAAIGECMVELSSAEEGLFRQAFAGDTLNTAIYTARSNASSKRSDHSALDISYVTAIGKDHFSENMLTFLASEQLNCDYVARVDDKIPGLYSIQLDDTGERSFSYWRSDSAAKCMFTRGLDDQQRNALAQEFDLYYLSGITLAILNVEDRALLKESLQQARQRGAKVAFDTNYRPRLWSSQQEAQQVVNDFLQLTDIALVTFDDEHALFGDRSAEETIARLSHLSELVIKQGGDGCTILTQQNGQLFVPAMRVPQVIDTTSAGDAFNGGYLARRLLGDTPEAAARFAHQLAGTVIQYKGAIIPLEITNKLIKD